jgi:FkbM family methyltransferase
MSSETTPPLSAAQQELLQLFHNVRKMRDQHGLTMFEFIPPRNSLLSMISGDTPIPLCLFPDEAIGLFTFVNKAWDPSKIHFFASKANLYEKVCLVDVGANIGLFTRQLASVTSNIFKAFCYEPLPRNFEMLSKNLQRWPNAVLINAALSNEIGTLELYVDPSNTGGHSLNKSAVPVQDHSIASVSVRRAAVEESNWLSLNSPIFYKSDTQGFDEFIATDLSLDFWQKVRCATLELWRIDKPKIDENKFASILNLFPFKAYDSNPEVMISTSEILEYCRGRDEKCEDLLCWH